MAKKICEKCKREMSRLYPVYDSKSGGYIMVCQKDATKFIKANPLAHPMNRVYQDKKKVI